MNKCLQQNPKRLCYNELGGSMLKKYKHFIFLFIFFIVTFITMFFCKIDSDLMWNFGYSYNTANGMMMYKDFNMVISPLYPTLTGLFMKLFGSNMIVFYLINAFYATLVAYFSYKINPKAWLFTIPFILFSCLANYNTLCILFCLFLIYLENKKANDYYLGFCLGLAFLTKINIGLLLCIPTLYYFKDFKKIGKRIVGFLIPNILVIIFFLFTNNLYNYIDYVFLGILDFAGNNLQLSYFIAIIPFILLYLGYLLFKEKNISYFYAIMFLGLIYPVMNELHVMMAIIPSLILITKKHSLYLEKISFIGLVFMIFPLIGLYLDNKNQVFKYDDNIFKYRYIQSEYIENRDVLKRHFDNNFENVCLILYDNYIYKFLLDLPINKYDVLLYGNMGYNGTQKIIDYLDSLKKDTYFVLETTINGAQYNMEVVKYIQQNYDLKTLLGNFYIYQK